MAIPKPIVKIPPIVSVKSGDRHGGSVGSPGDYHEEPNYRVFGVFVHLNSQGTPRGAIEISGNIARFHTCCGGWRVSALRVDYRQYDSWSPHSTFLENPHNEGRAAATWQAVRLDPSLFPTINEWSGQPELAAGWNADMCLRWGRAALATQVKTWMAYDQRALVVAMDRTGGHTDKVLSMMRHLDGVLYTYPLTVVYQQSPGTHSRALGYSREEFIGHLSRAWGYRENNSFQKVRAYGGLRVRNMNSGNQIQAISVVPYDGRRKQPQLSAAANPYKYVQYTHPTDLASLLSFYDSNLFRKILPQRPSYA